MRERCDFHRSIIAIENAFIDFIDEATIRFRDCSSQFIRVASIQNSRYVLFVGIAISICKSKN
jgi:hypothetical protein